MSAPATSHAERARRGSFGQAAVRRLARRQPMGIGAYMAAAHRLASLVLTVYLFVHLYTLSSVLDGPRSFDRLMALFRNTGVRLLELGLVVIVVFHTANGIRLLLLHLWPGLSQRWLAYATLALTALVGIVSLPIFLAD